jgi:Ca2+-binding RTX toxin-like protein
MKLKYFKVTLASFLLSVISIVNAEVVLQGGTGASGAGNIVLTNGTVVPAGNGAYFNGATTPASDWVWDAANSNGASNPLIFTFTFSLADYDVSTAELLGLWGIDNVGTISLNGTQLSTAPVVSDKIYSPIGSPAADTVALGPGDNCVDVGDGANTVAIDTSDNGNNVVIGGIGADTITAGNGDNRVHAGDGANTISLGSGANVIIGGSGADTITALGAGDDGNNYIDVGDGANTVTTGSGDDIIIGGSGVDTIASEAGDNYISIGDGANTVATGSGADIIIGGSGADTIDSGAGDDFIIAGSGVDTIDSGADNDIIFGNIGDGIDGGAGNDTLNLIDLGDPSGYSIVFTNAAETSGTITMIDPSAPAGVLTFANIENIVNEVVLTPIQPTAQVVVMCNTVAGIFSPLEPFSAAQGSGAFLPGINVLTFNVGSGDLPGALRASVEVTAVPAGVDHYAVSFDGSTFDDSNAVTCEAVDVTITAHNDTDAPIAPGAGVSINLSTSTAEGFWSNPDVGTINDTGGGTASYTFAANESVTLRFNHTVAAINPNPVSIDINSGDTLAGENPSIQFFDSGFRLIDNADQNIGSVAAPFHQVAGTESGEFYLQAIQTDYNTGQCVGTFADGADVDVFLGAECINPIACAGEQLTISNNGNDYPIATNDDASVNGPSEAALTSATLRFSADSKAPLTMEYADVGQLQLHAKYRVLNDDGSDSGTDIVGSSDGVVFKPFDLIVTTIESTDSPAVANPETTNIGLGFLPSATPFRLVVQSVNADGGLTPNFGNEIVPEGLDVSVNSLVYPTGIGSDNGSLTASNSFIATSTAGEFENTVISWDEAGSFTAIVAIEDADYLGAGDVTATPSSTIGRFYPAAFNLSSDIALDSCAATFTYFDEPGIEVGFTLEAVNLGNVKVDNYDNSELDYVTGSINFAAENNDDGVDLSSRVLAVAAIGWDDGVGSFADSTVSFLRDTVIESSMNSIQLGIQINDTDDNSIALLDMHPIETSDITNCVVNGDCTFRKIGTPLELLYGRLFIQDVHGPESEALSLPFQTEYWNGTRFIVNADDTCTSIARTAIKFNNAVITLDPALTVTVGDGTSTGDFLDIDVTNVNSAAGDMGLIFSAPGSNNTGSIPVDVELTLMPWLQYDWDENGSLDTDVPTATVTFGSYRSNDRIIYWQEVLN